MSQIRTVSEFRTDYATTPIMYGRDRKGAYGTYMDISENKRPPQNKTKKEIKSSLCPDLAPRGPDGETLLLDLCTSNDSAQSHERHVNCIKI